MTANLRVLAQTRLREAGALLAASQWSGAYYLAGYAIECGLKARITRSFGRYTMPDLTLVKNSYTHDLDALVGIAQLRGQLTAAQGADPVFAVNWALVKDWSETSRYETWTDLEARELYRAITQRGHGVFRWIKANW